MSREVTHSISYINMDAWTITITLFCQIQPGQVPKYSQRRAAGRRLREDTLQANPRTQEISGLFGRDVPILTSSLDVSQANTSPEQLTSTRKQIFAVLQAV